MDTHAAVFRLVGVFRVFFRDRKQSNKRSANGGGFGHALRSWARYPSEGGFRRGFIPVMLRKPSSVLHRLVRYFTYALV